MDSSKYIPVLPKNYRAIALHAIEIAVQPHVYLNQQLITDYTEQGSLTQKGMASLIDFEVKDGHKTIVGFHDHPTQMFIPESYQSFALYCQAQGWLEIEGPAS